MISAEPIPSETQVLDALSKSIADARWRVYCLAEIDKPFAERLDALLGYLAFEVDRRAETLAAPAAEAEQLAG